MAPLMGPRLSRRRFLLATLPVLLAPRLARGEGPSRNAGTYHVDVSVLYGLLTFSLSGTTVEEIDWSAGRYRVMLTGEGPGTAHRTEATGFILAGRFFPAQTNTYQALRGRETRVAVTFDYQRRLVEYHLRGQTLLLGRLRQVDDTVSIPPGQTVDDLASASLNFAANKLETDGHGSYRTAFIRRAWKENEGPDDVSPGGYRAEIVPVTFRVSPDPATGRLNGLLDLTTVSSWARRGQPARLTFGPTRHLESVHSSLILGTTIAVRLSSNT